MLGHDDRVAIAQVLQLSIENLQQAQEHMVSSKLEASVEKMYEAIGVFQYVLARIHRWTA